MAYKNAVANNNEVISTQMGYPQGILLRIWFPRDTVNCMLKGKSGVHNCAQVTGNLEFLLDLLEGLAFSINKYHLGTVGSLNIFYIMTYHVLLKPDAIFTSSQLYGSLLLLSFISSEPRVPNNSKHLLNLKQHCWVDSMGGLRWIRSIHCYCGIL